METHAHHIHKAPGQGWKHYFFEFLMLFLAITLGFFVENQREHFVEQKRAKEYAANLYKELKEDTLRLHHLILWNRNVVKALDSFCMLATQKTPTITNGMLYYYVKPVGWYEEFSTFSTTMEQLKSSGNMRLLKSDIAFFIGNYEKALKSMELEYSLSQHDYNIINDMRLKIFDGNILRDIRRNDSQFLRDSIFALNLPLLNDDPKMMKEFVGRIRAESGYLGEGTNYLEGMSEKLPELIRLLEKEYHLK